MIIDSHAHYAHRTFDAEFRYLYGKDGAYATDRTDREGLLEEMKRQDIVGVIEPSIAFDDVEKQISVVSAHAGFMWLALGVHPTRCSRAKWKNRKQILRLIRRESVIAVGETGLDYHLRYESEKDKKRDVARQKRWFCYFIRLAHKKKLPLILHVRKADGDALRILKKYKRRLHGGVAHCFSGDLAAAEEYLSLGFSLGIGGKLLDDDEYGRTLCDVVRRAPLDRLLVETDAPFLYPQKGKDACPSESQKKKLLNSSLILPMVIRRIAELRGEPYASVERAVFCNTIRVFGLPANIDGRKYGSSAPEWD